MLTTRTTSLEAFLSRPEGADSYLSGKRGANQIFKFRSLAAFEMLENLADVSFAATRAELKDRNLLDPILDQYLDELRDVMTARKSRITDVGRAVTLRVHFDFSTLVTEKYRLDPRDVFMRNGLEVSVFHSDHHQKYLANYFRQYGASLAGLSYFIHRHPARMLYRQVERAPAGA